MMLSVMTMAVLLSGISVGLGIYLLGTWLSGVAGAAARGEADGPSTFQAMLPAPIAWLWPLAQRLGKPLQPYLLPSWVAGVDASLNQAGLAYLTTAAEFMAAKMLLALGLGLLSGAIAAFSGLSLVGSFVLAAGCGFVMLDQWLKALIKRRQRQILKGLPFFLDLTALAVESGRNLSGAIQRAVERMRPGPLKDELLAVLRDARAGRARVEALRDLAVRVNMPAVTSLVAILVQGELTGASLAPVLRAIADQRRTERFHAAEKLAMEAPVRMLAPLVLLIFPCTFLVIGFPIASRLFSSGLAG